MVRVVGLEPTTFTSWVSELKSDASLPISPHPHLFNLFYYTKNYHKTPIVCKILIATKTIAAKPRTFKSKTATTPRKAMHPAAAKSFLSYLISLII